MVAESCGGLGREASTPPVPEPSRKAGSALGRYSVLLELLLCVGVRSNLS